MSLELVSEKITNKRRVDDELCERRVILLLELVISDNFSAHEQNLWIMDDIVPQWMKNVTDFNNPYALGWASIGYGLDNRENGWRATRVASHNQFESAHGCKLQSL